HEQLYGGVLTVQTRPPSTSNVTDVTPTLSVAEIAAVTIPKTVVLAAGKLIETLGGVVSLGGAPFMARVTAEAASRRPDPKVVSQPGEPKSSADCCSILMTLAGVSEGLAEYIRAATPATSGAENEVPQAAP